MSEQRPKDERPASDNRPLWALAVVIAIAAIAWFVMDRLWSDSKTQDCIMSGRSNCAPVEGAGR